MSQSPPSPQSGHDYIETWIDEFCTCLLMEEIEMEEELARLMKTLAASLSTLTNQGDRDMSEGDHRHLVHELESSWALACHSFLRTLAFTVGEAAKIGESFQDSIASTYSFDDEEGEGGDGSDGEGEEKEGEHRPEYAENVWYTPEAEGLFLSAPSLVPSLNVLILLVGSRGDIQPFIALAQGLRDAGHNVRLRGE